MSLAASTARAVTVATIATGRSRDRNPVSMIFLAGLWFSLFFGVMVLIVLIVDTAIDGAPRFDARLITDYQSVLRPEETGFRAGILGTLWSLRHLRTTNTTFLTVPVTEPAITEVDGVSFVRLDETKGADLWDAVRRDQVAEFLQLSGLATN